MIDGKISVGGYLVNNGELVINPPIYNSEQCLILSEDGTPCAFEWSLLALEGEVRTTDNSTVTLLLGPTGINVKLTENAIKYWINFDNVDYYQFIFMAFIEKKNRCFTSSSRFRFIFDMDARFIGWIASIGNFFGISIIFRSQFSNLLPILIIALGIDDSLHVLHRYKEERRNSKRIIPSTRITLDRVGKELFY